MKTKLYRHGEIVFKKISKLPTGLTETKTNIFAKGSHGHDHSFKGGKIYLLPQMKDWTIGYFVAKDTALYHEEHSPKGEAKLPNGVYELLKQKEHTPQGLVPVVD
jgi:hypothetical protein